MKFFVRFGNPRQVPPSDTTPPTTPGGLSATAANPSVLSLATLSTDNVAVTGYQIWRKLGSGGTYALIATTTTWPWTDNTVVNGNTYFWETRAFDGAGNFSSFSAAASAAIPGGLLPDTTNPNTPGSAPGLVANGQTSITISLPLTTDSTANAGTQVVSGMQQYLVQCNGIVVGSPVLQPSASLAFSAGVDIGDPLPPGTDADVSGTYTLTCGGIQWTGTSDQIHLVAGLVTGDFDFSARIVSVVSSSGNPYAKAGIIARDGADPAAQYFAGNAFTSTGGTISAQGLDIEFRTPPGTAAGWNGALLAHALPYYSKISRRGNTFTGYVSSDGVSWGSAITTQVIPMANSVSVGLACSEQTSGDGVTGAQVTAVFDSATFAVGSNVDFTDNFAGSSSPVARLYTYAGVDNVGNVGAYSPSLSVTPTATSGHAIKWNPGFYAQSSSYAELGNTLRSARAAEIALIRGGPSEVLGWQGIYYWPLFESGTLGVYDFSEIDADYVAITGYQSGKTTGAVYTSPRRYMVYLQSDEYFFSVSPAICTPSYILNNSTYGAAPAGQSTFGWWVESENRAVAVAKWRAPVADRLIALIQALAAYELCDGYTLNSSPYVELIIPFFETAAAPDGSEATDPSYSNSNLVTQVQRINAAGTTAFPNTMFGCSINFLNIPFPDNSNVNALVQSLVGTVTAGVGGDTFGLSNYPADATAGQLAYLGQLGSSTLIGSIPWISQVQSTELGYNMGEIYEPSDIFAMQNSKLQATHGIWQIAALGAFLPDNTSVDGYWLGSASSYAQWATAPSTYGGVLYLLMTNTLSNTAYPSKFP